MTVMHVFSSAVKIPEMSDKSQAVILAIDSVLVDLGKKVTDLCARNGLHPLQVSSPNTMIVSDMVIGIMSGVFNGVTKSEDKPSKPSVNIPSGVDANTLAGVIGGDIANPSVESVAFVSGGSVSAGNTGGDVPTNPFEDVLDNPAFAAFANQTIVEAENQRAATPVASPSYVRNGPDMSGVL